MSARRVSETTRRLAAANWVGAVQRVDTRPGDTETRRGNRYLARLKRDSSSTHPTLPSRHLKTLKNLIVSKLK